MAARENSNVANNLTIFLCEIMENDYFWLVDFLLKIPGVVKLFFQNKGYICFWAKKGT